MIRVSSMLQPTGIGKQKGSCRMLSEKNSEKVAVYVALIASILALVITIFNYFAPSGTLFSGSAGAAAPSPARRSGGGGRMMRGAPLPEEYLQKYEAQIKLLDDLCGMLENEVKIGNVTEKELRLRELEREKWRLNLMRLKNGRRAFSSFADTYLVAKCYDALLRDAEVKFEAGIAPLYEIKELQARRDEAELRLMELERRLDPEKVAAAKAAVESYRGKLSDEQLETLLAAEQRFFGPR